MVKKDKIIRKEPFTIGTRVSKDTHPSITGEITDIKTIGILGKEYRIYKIVSDKDGTEWVNELYLTER
jgi:hypothetical protein